MMLRSSSLFALLSTLVIVACSSGDDPAGSSESAATESAAPFVVEGRFEAPGKPTTRLRTTFALPSDVRSSSVNAWHNTTSDKGSFQHDSCVTDVLFPAGNAHIEVLDDEGGEVRSTYDQPLTLGIRFETESNPGTTCYPHAYPSTSQDVSLTINPEPIVFADGSKLDAISFGYEMHLDAVREGDSWRLTAVTFDPYSLRNENASAFYRFPSGAYGSTAIYEAGKRSPCTVTGHVDVASCALTDTYGVSGDPQPGTYHLAFDYRRKLEAGARVDVKYAERDGFTATEPTWHDGNEVELSRSGDAWQGEVTLTGKVRPVKGVSNPAERDVVSEPGAPSSLLYVFRIQHADGSVEWENGSGKKWGNYRTTGDQGGRYGYYGLTLPASCDGLGRSAELGVEIDVH